MANSKEEKGSVLMLGGVDPSYYSRDLNWGPVSRPIYWQLAIDNISMDRKAIACDGGCQGIVNTGTSLLTGRCSCVHSIQKIIHGKHYHNGEGHSGTCYSSFDAAVDDSPHSEIWVLGDVSLRLYFTVFDQENNRVGLAPAV